MDQNWSECPYCKREREALNKDANPEPAPEENKAVADKFQRGPTRVDQPSGRRETKYDAPPLEKHEALPVKSKAADNRRIVGVLATYSWRPEGEVFMVREGRTHIGAGKIKDDPDHQPVDVPCPMDELLSSDHALILVQQKRFFIQDLASVNGTFVNGEQLIPETMNELPNNAEIKTGKTSFTFLRIDAKSTPQVEVPRESTPAEAVRRPTTLK